MLDISYETLAVTRERLGFAKDRVTRVVSDVLAWKPTGTYDAGTTATVLHFPHSPDDQTA